MPIRDVHFKNGIFFCREVGRIDDNDARLWAVYAEKFANSSDLPIVALVDATQATRITALARQIFAEAAAIEGLQHGIIATANFQFAQNSRITGWLSLDNHTEIFETVAEARARAEAYARQIREDYQAKT